MRQKGGHRKTLRIVHNPDVGTDSPLHDGLGYMPARVHVGRHILRGEFPIGCIVRHAKFGLGTVQAITPRAIGASVSVLFSTVGTKTLILEYAKLERVG